ncbi:MAG: deoxynucleoside kinase [Shewanella sp.]|nr:deoxynucleoside kinase [Shewanella sp.]
MIGSGKTTLAQNLSRRLGWLYLPESQASASFLKDLFSEPKRWAFETQISFLVEKSVQLIDSISSGENIILDRSLYEDILIFADFFYKNGNIDKRSYKTYQTIANHFLEEVPAPDLIVFCESSITTIFDRIKNRSKAIDSLYTMNHLKAIHSKYESWASEHSTSPLYSINSQRWDFREKDCINLVASEIMYLLTSSDSLIDQLNLFNDETVKNEDGHIVALKPSQHNRNTSLQVANSISTPAKSWQAPVYPYVYIAAPFTGIATDYANSHDSVPTNQMLLFSDHPMHGLIKRGRYRKTLQNITRKLENIGLNTLLPHRDVNDWGKKTLNSLDVFSACSNHVNNCDIFFGLLGQSTGAHYEFGIARSQTKPCIIVHCEELNDSFIAEGIESDLNTLVLKCKKYEDVPHLLDLQITQGFIKKHITL